MMPAAAPRRLLVLALAGPSLFLLVAIAVMLGAALGGYQPLAGPDDLTLAEAAAIRDEAEVLRQIRAGADPNAPGTVRRGILNDAEYLLTPLEAAVAAGHAEVVQLLVQNGAVINQRTFPILFCLAQDNGATDIASFLNERAPAGVALDCASVRLPL